MTWEEFYENITKSNSVLLILPELLDYDTVCSSAIIYNILAKLDIKVQIAYSGNFNVYDDFDKIWKQAGVKPESFISSVEPVYYNIVIPDASTDAKVNWFFNGDKLNIKIVSEKKPLDLSKLAYYKDGGLYDWVILFNSFRLKDVGKIFENDPDRLMKFNIVSLGTLIEEVKGYRINSVYGEGISTTYWIIQKINNMGICNESIVSIALIALGWDIFALGHKDIEKLNLFTNLSLSYNIDVNTLTSPINQIDPTIAQLYELILRNIKFDEHKRIGYSILNRQEVAKLTRDKEVMLLNALLKLQLSKLYAFFFLIVYDESAGKTSVYVRNNKEENKNEFIDLVNKLNAFSNKVLAFANLGLNSFEALNRIFEALGAGGAVNSQANTNFQTGASTKQANEPLLNVTQTSPQNTQMSIPSGQSLTGLNQNNNPSAVPINLEPKVSEQDILAKDPPPIPQADLSSLGIND